MQRMDQVGATDNVVAHARTGEAYYGAGAMTMRFDGGTRVVCQGCSRVA